MDNRVIKKFAKYCGIMILSLMAIAGATYLSEKLFNQPDVLINLGLIAFGIYTLYGVAKIRVDIERDSEQRLLDKIRDLK